MFIHSILTKVQRVKSYSCSLRLLAGDLIQDVATIRMFWSRVWLLDALDIWEDDHFVYSLHFCYRPWLSKCHIQQGNTRKRIERHLHLSSQIVFFILNFTPHNKVGQCKPMGEKESQEQEEESKAYLLPQVVVPQKHQANSQSTEDLVHMLLFFPPWSACEPICALLSWFSGLCFLGVLYSLWLLALSFLGFPEILEEGSEEALQFGSLCKRSDCILMFDQSLHIG